MVTVINVTSTAGLEQVDPNDALWTLAFSFSCFWTLVALYFGAGELRRVECYSQEYRLVPRTRPESATTSHAASGSPLSGQLRWSLINFVY